MKLCCRVLSIVFVATSLRLGALIWIPWRPVAKYIRRTVVTAAARKLETKR